MAPTGFEPVTPSFRDCHSTTELKSQIKILSEDYSVRLPNIRLLFRLSQLKDSLPFLPNILAPLVGIEPREFLTRKPFCQLNYQRYFVEETGLEPVTKKLPLQHSTN